MQREARAFPALPGTAARRRALAGSLLAVLGLAVAFALLPSQGLTWDAPENIEIGERTWLLLLGGDRSLLDFSGPGVGTRFPGHPDFHVSFSREVPWQHWPFANVVSAATCHLLFRTLGVLGPVDAHHAAALLFFALLLGAVHAHARDHLGRGWAALCVVLLLCVPRLVGHGFVNLKDVPDLALLAVLLLALDRFLRSGRARWALLAGLALGLAAATKPDVAYVPLVVAPWAAWMLARRWRGAARPRRDVALAACALGVAGLAWIAWWPPIWWGARVGGETLSGAEYLARHVAYVLHVGTDTAEVGWKLWPLRFLVYATPLSFLGVAAAGLGVGLASLRRRPVVLLWAGWLGVPLLRACAPGLQTYDGMRHFLGVLPPLALFATLAVRALARAGRAGPPWARHAWIAVVAVLVTEGALAHAASQPHPLTYFNALAGGLGGAQRADVPFASDYWLGSYRDAVAWLDANAPRGALVHVRLAPQLLRMQGLREDLEVVDALPPADTGREVLLLGVPRRLIRPGARSSDPLFKSALQPRLEVVHEVHRQGGLVYRIARLRPAGEAPAGR